MQEVDCLVSTAGEGQETSQPTTQDTTVQAEDQKNTKKTSSEKKSEEKSEETHDHEEQTTDDGRPKYVPHGKPKGEVVQGSKDTIVSNNYIMTLQLHDEPDIEAVGHAWKITSFRLAQKLKMLV